MNARALALGIIPGILLLSGCIIIPFPHTDFVCRSCSGRVLDASTLHPIAGAKVVVAGLPGTGVRTDSSGHFLTKLGLSWVLISEDTVDGDLGVPFESLGQGYLIVTHPGYRQGKLDRDPSVAGAHSVLLGGLDHTPLPVGDILLRRQH
jgi:hypothetical protein